MKSRSFLVLEIGTLNTRAGYFEEVGSRLRFIDAASGESTHYPLPGNALAGVLESVKSLETKLNKKLMQSDELITPEAADSSGVDICRVNFSFGTPVSTLVVDLSKKDMGDSIRGVIARNNLKITDSVNGEDVLDLATMLRIIEDSAIGLLLIWVEGSVDSKKLNALLEVFLVAQAIFGIKNSPSLLMIGDERKISQIVQQTGIKKIAGVEIVEIRQKDQIELDQRIDQAVLHLIENHRKLAISSLKDVSNWCKAEIGYSDQFTKGFIAAISKNISPLHNLLHVDFGASSILITARVNGQLVQQKFENLGIGSQFVNSLDSYPGFKTLVKRDAQSAIKIQNYAFQRSLMPEYIPDRDDEAMIHYELMAGNLRTAFLDFYSNHFPRRTRDKRELWIEKIYLSGEVFTNPTRFHYMARLLLEGLNLRSPAEIYLDRYNIASMIGRLEAGFPEIAEKLDLRGSILPSFWVIPVRSSEHEGELVLKIRLGRQGEAEEIVSIYKGDLTRINLPPGKSKNVTIVPVGHTDAGWGKRTPHEGTFPEGFNTLIIDAREQPLNLPVNADEHKNLVLRWQVALGDE